MVRQAFNGLLRSSSYLPARIAGLRLLTTNGETFRYSPFALSLPKDVIPSYHAPVGRHRQMKVASDTPHLRPLSHWERGGQDLSRGRGEGLFSEQRALGLRINSATEESKIPRLHYVPARNDSLFQTKVSCCNPSKGKRLPPSWPGAVKTRPGLK